MQIEIKGWLCRRQWEWQSEADAIWEFVAGNKPTGVESLIPVQEYTIFAEVPDGRFIAERVAAIDEVITQQLANTQAYVTNLQRRKAELLCLEMAK